MVEAEDNSAEEIVENLVGDIDDDSEDGTEDDSMEETDDDERIEVEGKKGKLIARNLSLQEARDFFDNL